MEIKVYSAGYNERILACAAHEGDVELCRLMLARGVNVNNTFGDVRHCDNYNRTPLHWAAESGNVGTCALLLDSGADIEARTSNGSVGETPLWLAARYGNEEVCQLLLDRGADIEARDAEGFTVLIAAVRGGNEEVCRLLVSRGANIDACDPRGNDTFYHAKWAGNKVLMRLFQEAKGKQRATGEPASDKPELDCEAYGLPKEDTVRMGPQSKGGLGAYGTKQALLKLCIAALEDEYGCSVKEIERLEPVSNKTIRCVGIVWDLESLDRDMDLFVNAICLGDLEPHGTTLYGHNYLDKQIDIIAKRLDKVLGTDFASWICGYTTVGEILEHLEQIKRNKDMSENAKEYDSFLEWLDEQADYGLCSPPITGEQAFKFIKMYLLPKGWYCINSQSGAQADTEALHTILLKHSKAYKQEYRRRIADWREWYAMCDKGRRLFGLKQKQ